MSEEMAPSWRTLASAASRSIKGYIAQQREIKQGYPASRAVPPHPGGDFSKKQSWSQWAGQKLRRGSQGEYDNSGDRLSLFPGWAARRYLSPPKANDDDTPFDVDVFVSGFASKLTGVGFNTRGGKAFLRLAKTFAALPRLPASSPTKSAEDLELPGVHLPPLPDEITDESEMKILDDKLRQLQFDARSIESGDTLDTESMTSRSHEPRTPSSASATSSNGFPQSFESTAPSLLVPAPSELHKWHANLEARLHPFWSSVLSNRTVRVSLYAADPSLYDSDGQHTDESGSSERSISPEKQPILTREVITAVDGSFQLKLSVPWESLCVHPSGVHVAFGGAGLEHELFIVAELLAPLSPVPSTTQVQVPYQPRQQPIRPILPVQPRAVTVAASVPVPLTYSAIRVISDIDDTVKLSGILSGARAVFRNVFVKDLRESVIPGMGDWYMGMWKRGVRFHYVSNGPFELLPVLNEFLQLSQLPPGSIRLRSYGGRSLFNGLLSAPAMRKRTAVHDVLNHFPEARFILVGDTGEQDLELYAEFARARPEQILAVFVRDAVARGDTAPPPLDDPTGSAAYELGLFDASNPGSASSSSSSSSPPTPRRSGVGPRPPSKSMSEGPPQTPPPVPKKPMRTYSGPEMPTPVPPATAGARGVDYFGVGAGARVQATTITEEPQEAPMMTASSADGPRAWPPRGFASWTPTRGQSVSSQSGAAPEAERRRNELQMRLWRARYDVAPHIPIRIFREPDECVELEHILKRV